MLLFSSVCLKIQVDQLKNAFHNEYVRYSMLHALDAASKNGDTLEASMF